MPETMKVGENVFVYGTLKSGHGANDYMQGRSEFVREDRITAKIYCLGGFPGVKEPHKEYISEGPTVVGEVYRITDEALPHILDRYEGYPLLYTRKQVETASGDVAWVYEYNGEPNEERLVSTGVWER